MLSKQTQRWPGVPNESRNSDYEVGPNDQGAPGTVFCFAYAMPYSYSELLHDLEQSKKFLLSHGGNLVNHQASKFALEPKPLP